jgi:DUF917 family protein
MAGWRLDHDSLSDLVTGCAILGSGGGGETHAAVILLGDMIVRGRPIDIVEPEQLDDDALVVCVGFVGAPITLQEKLLAEGEIVPAIEAMQARLGRPIDALVAAEIGGLNGLSPLIAAGLTGLPVVNADGMGRAFPRSDQVTFAIYGEDATPTIVGNEHGELVVIERAANDRIENLVRSLSVAMGSKCFSVDYPLTGRALRRHGVQLTLSLARDIGRVVNGAAAGAGEPFEQLQAMLARDWGRVSRCLFEGRVTDKRHEVRTGFGFGRVQITAAGGEVLDLHFQNEFLLAEMNGAPLCSTPDILSVVEADSLRNIGSDAVRYGQRVKLLAVEAPGLMTSPEALARVGPRAFGFDLDFASLAGRERGVRTAGRA